MYIPEISVKNILITDGRCYREQKTDKQLQGRKELQKYSGLQKHKGLPEYSGLQKYPEFSEQAGQVSQ